LIIRFVVSSESQGYGNRGSVSDDRRYNVPILHRTYDCRHGRTLYTCYAVGLATVASPDIMKPGVIFPDFLATGKHSVHNPVNLVLEESSKLWPGLPISALLRYAKHLLVSNNRADTIPASVQVLLSSLLGCPTPMSLVWPELVSKLRLRMNGSRTS
jgi:hypothetical protein